MHVLVKKILTTKFNAVVVAKVLLSLRVTLNKRSIIGALI